MALKVLVCDDERNIVRLIQVNLERLGYQVTTAYDGREALRKISEETPDLVLLDVMMPYVDGMEVLRTMRRNPLTANVPVILLTVQAQEGDDAAGLAAGADFYMTKPFNPDELQEFLKKICVSH
jgi:two-component system alkaline phosphatase synthesis response regulator PhoP/two-component system response regulator VicR